MINWIDCVILAIIGLSMLTGLMRGFVKEVIALCIWIIAIWVAYHHSQPLAQWLSSYIEDKTARTIAAFVLVLLAMLLVGGVINALFGLFLKRSGLSGTDRLLGMGFGFIRGIFIVSVLLAMINMTSLANESVLKNSTLAPSLEPVVHWLQVKMPDLIQKANRLGQHDLIDIGLKE